MDLNFEQLLAAHNQEFKEAEVYSDWMPDDGEYIASLVKLDKGVSKDSIMWWKLTGRIESTEIEKFYGKEFTVGYYTSKAFGILKGTIKVLAGNLINDLNEAHTILQASVGKVVRVKVETKPSKKHDGREFTNCYIKEVYTTEAVEEVPATDVEIAAHTSPDDNITETISVS